MANARKNGKYKTGNYCELNSNVKNSRIYALVFFIFAIALAVSCRLYFFQIRSYDYYQALAENQHSLFRNLIPKRGEIFLKDRDALYPAAVNKETKMAYAVPKEIEDAAAVSDRLSVILGLDKDELKAKLEKKDDMYEVLKHRLSNGEIDEIKKSKFKGVRLADEDFRYYPAGELASHILGFVGWKDNEFGGRYGTELFFENQLKGENGKLIQNKDASGKGIATGEKEIAYAKNGDSFVLSLDHIVQYETEKLLASAIEKYQAERGAIIVMEVATGKILAMANYPSFNPNDYAKTENMEAFRNLAVSDPYECGSVFKTFTLASAIDSGKVNADTTYIDTGAVSEAGYTIRNSDSKAYGKQTMTNVLEKSLNTGVIFAEKLTGNETFLGYMQKFGFGDLTGVDIFGEAAGDIKNLKNSKRDIEFFTASYGQGITVTPLQLISAYNVIANNGVFLKPQIVEKIMHSDGTVSEIASQEVRRVISQQSAYETGRMLESVVANGHGKMAGVPGYLVAGKTGTAQVASNEVKGYEEGKSIGSFAGFAPLDNPKFTVLVRLDDPKTVEWAESSAAPTFGELMKFLLEYYRVEPTEKYSSADLDKFNQTHNLRSYFIKKQEQNDEGSEQEKE